MLAIWLAQLATRLEAQLSRRKAGCVVVHRACYHLQIKETLILLEGFSAKFLHFSFKMSADFPTRSLVMA